MSPQKTAIYLDHNASSPLSPVVRSRLQALTVFGNPSSVHREGRRTRAMVEDAREAVARSIGERAAERVIFTSSGTEANQQVLRSRGPCHWVTTAIEHASILELSPPATVPVSRSGVWCVEDVLAAITPETRLVSVGWVNNETGACQPVADLHSVLLEKRPDILLHIDAAQAWGKIAFSVSGWEGSVALTASGHKVGSLGGVGFIWTSPGTRLLPLLIGTQEKGLRGGTENALGIATMGWAAEEINPARFEERTLPLRQQLEVGLKMEFDAIIHGESRVPNTVSFFVPGAGDQLVLSLDLEGFCVSSGAACSSGVRKPSHVLLAMGLSPEVARSSVRVSLSPENTPEEVLGFIEALRRVRIPAYGR